MARRLGLGALFALQRLAARAGCPPASAALLSSRGLDPRAFGPGNAGKCRPDGYVSAGGSRGLSGSSDGQPKEGRPGDKSPLPPPPDSADCEFWGGGAASSSSPADRGLTPLLVSVLLEQLVNPIRLEYTLLVIRRYFDRGFVLAEFESGAAAAYEQVRLAVAARDWDSLRACVSPRLLERLKHQAGDEDASHHRAGALDTFEVTEAQCTEAAIVLEPASRPGLLQVRVGGWQGSGGVKPSAID